MKQLKWLTRKATIFLVLIVSLFSCKNDDEVIRIDGTTLGTEETHFQTEPFPGNNDKFTHCREKNSNHYYFTASENCCIYEVRALDAVSEGYDNRYEAIGGVEFNFDKGFFYLFAGTGTYGERPNDYVFGGGTTADQGPEPISFSADGSFSIHQFGVGNFEKRCSDWAELNPRCVAWNTEVIGQSTPDRKEVDVMIIWSDCDRVVVDTGYVHMWREW